MIVEAQYNWKGVLTGYRRGDSCIPIDPQNRDCYEIQQAIANGECLVNEPAMGDIERAFDRNQNFSGYHTQFGFVPSYQDNHLLKLINEQVKDGRCFIIESPKVTPLPMLEKLIFSMVLEQPWPHIRADFSGQLYYASNFQSEKRPFRFILKNLPSQADDKLHLLLKHHDCLTSPPFGLSALQFGVIEIEVPIKELRRLFQGEHSIIQAWMSPFFADILEQHYAQTRRRPSEGPDVGWLISHVNFYMGHFVVEFSNQIIDAFWLEYGQSPVPYISEGSIGSNCVIIGCTSSGEKRLHTMMVNNMQSHGLAGEWHSSLLQRYEQEASSTEYYRGTALRRVAEMVRLAAPDGGGDSGGRITR